MIEGIGPKLAERIVETFGTETLEILDADPDRITEVEGIGEVRGERITQAWGEQRAVRRVMVFLQSHGVTPGRAMRIWREYGPAAVQVLQDNPYQLAEDVWGIGFKTADNIARELGIEPEADERLRAGLLYELRGAGDEGHMYLPVERLLERASETLAIDGRAVERERLRGPLDQLRQGEQIVVESGAADDGDAQVTAIYRAPAYGAEVGAANHVKRLIGQQSWLEGAEEHTKALGEHLGAVEAELGFELAEAQGEAAVAAWRDDVVVITGGPGTGKTTIVEAVCKIGERLGRTVALAAPTGRAAKRLSEASGRDAKTLHRLLEYSFEQGGFQRDEDNPLNVDLLVVDEASMLDTFLLHSMVRALPDDAGLLLVGDVDQLPSVGPGDVLADLMASGSVPVVRLTQVFRQAEQSAIVLNAHRINDGQMPVVPNRQGDELVDFYTIQADEPEEARTRILQLVSDRIPDAFGYDPVEDVQVLSPMHRGEVGCDSLNDAIQARLHPDRPGIERAGTTWKQGDRVMQMRNNYDLEVFNGDVGRIERIDEQDEQLVVDYDGEPVPYTFDQLDELSLAYAVTVHKSQGSEYPVVIIPVVTQHYIMLQRNLLYTAVTRAEELVVLVGSRRAVNIAVTNDDARHRFTRLDRRVAGKL
jgi:exodeoxyribonuclease V alpha subunit